MKILIVGNFGYRRNNLNGQTVRTRTIKETLIKYLPKSTVKYFDTSYILNIKKILSFICDYLSSKIVVVALARRGVKILYPIIVLGNSFFRKQTEFVAIGGWLDEYIEERPQSIKWFMRADTIFVQLESLKIRLENRGLNNVIYLPNFRLYNHKIKTIDEDSNIEKFVFYSRIIEEKGVKIAIDATNYLNLTLNKNISLDIFGPIEASYKDKFQELIAKSNMIKYNGILNPEDAISTLSKYQVLLFPSYYRGEGFPGTILDAFSAGLAVIASDWKYNSEIIINMKTGLICKAKDTKDLINSMEFAINNPFHVYEMRKNALLESKKYDEELVGSILVKQIEENYRERLI